MKRTAAILVLVLTLGLGVAACAPAGPSATELKAQCFSNEQLIGASMKLFYADAGIYPPLSTVTDKLHLKCPSGGAYTFDAATGVVTCSVHGHP